MAAGFTDDAVMDDEMKTAIALFRYGVLGPLVSARLEHGDRRAYFEAAAARRHVLPDGREITLSPRTVEAWFYAYEHGGLAALRPSSRSDIGKSRAIDDDLAGVIRRAKLEKPRRSVVRIIRMLERAGLAAKGALSKASVHRVLKAAGISSRPVRGASCERRSFIAAHAGDLLVGDALHPRSPPKDCKGKTFFDRSDGYARLRRAFQELVDERGLGVLVADAGVGKTAAIRNLCAEPGARGSESNRLTAPGRRRAPASARAMHGTYERRACRSH
jgi:hypothetical protein